MELHLLADYGINQQIKPQLLQPNVISQILSLELSCVNNEDVVTQLLLVYTVIAEDPSYHSSLLNSIFISSFSEYRERFQTNPLIMSSYIYLFFYFSKSEEGRYYLRNIGYIKVAMSCVQSFPDDTVLCKNVLGTIESLLLDKRHQSILLTDEVVKLCIAVLNASQRSQSTVEQALRVLRVLSSMGQQMTQRMVNNGAVPSVLMATAAYPQAVGICTHGVRTLQWILEVPTQSLVRIMLDEEVMQLCADLLRRHDDPRVLQFLCGVLVKFCYYLDAEERVAQLLQSLGVIETLGKKMVAQCEEDCVVHAGIQVLCVLASTRKGRGLLVDSGAAKAILTCATHMQRNDTVGLTSGILWKFTLVPELMRQMLQYRALNVLLKLMGEFTESLLIQRNIIGCLFMMTRENAMGKEDPKAEWRTIEDFRQRLGLPLLFKTMQAFLESPDYCYQLIPLLQNLGKNKQCFEYFVSQKLPCIMVKIVVIHKRNVTLTSMALLLLLSLIKSEDMMNVFLFSNEVNDLSAMLTDPTSKLHPAIAKDITLIMSRVEAYNQTLPP